MNVKDHYDKHLGNFYTWMAGDFVQRQFEQESFFRRNNIAPMLTKTAFDLGAGHGLQTVSLANLGFHVKAVDFNEQLRHELSSKCADLSVDVINDEILQFLERESSQPEVIVSMGDTLTHLSSVQDVARFFRLSADRLVDRGKLVLSFRDYSVALRDENRFISVKQDDQRILTCFLEYFPDHVMVHDILHEKRNDEWNMMVSAYPKLRLSPNHIIELIMQNRMKVIAEETIKGMLHLIAEKVSL